MTYSLLPHHRGSLATCVVISLVGAASLACTDDAGSDTGSDTGSDDAAVVPDCVDFALEGCALLYPATYDQVWAQTLSSGCAEFGTACHASEDAAGAIRGMTFVEPQQSLDHMLMGSDAALIVPGDPLCSPLFVRLASDDASIRMPPGSDGLAEGALCSIATWIADGATP